MILIIMISLDSACIFRCSFSVSTDPTDPPLAGDGFDTGISEEDGGNWDENAVG